MRVAFAIEGKHARGQSSDRLEGVQLLGDAI